MSENKKITIAVHNGHFHGDDIFAVATMLLVLGEGANVSVIRTRDQATIEKADYVLDVGQVYDELKNRFDHHQIGGAGKRINGIPYASFGLVWKKYGKELSGSKEVAETIDRKLAQPTDARDNALTISNQIFDDVSEYSISSFFGAFSPTWAEGSADTDDIFMSMVNYAKEVLLREIKVESDGLEAAQVVEKIYRESADKRLIIFDRYYPSNEVLSHFPEPLFTIYLRSEGTWGLKAVSDHLFVNRKDLPKEWAGKENQELEDITGVKDVVFCHKTQYLAVAKTKEAILKLAELALNS